MQPKLSTKLWIGVALIVPVAAAALAGILGKVEPSASKITRNNPTNSRSAAHNFEATGESKVPTPTEGTISQDAVPLAPTAALALRTVGRPTGHPIDVASHRPDGPAQAGRKVELDRTSVIRALSSARQGQMIDIPLPDGTVRRGTVNVVQIDSPRTRLGGSIQSGGSFSFGTDGASAAGLIQIPSQKLAFELLPEEGNKLVLVERRLGDVVCEGIPPADQVSPSTKAIAPLAVPSYSSRPSATAVLYIDFDGEIVTDTSWNEGRTINAPASGFSSTQIKEIFDRVKEDFWVFNIDVTTNPNRYASAPVGKRMRCIVTPNNAAAPGAGGVAMLHSFRRAGSDLFSATIPCWVFNVGSAKSCADAVTHEFGHTLGLRHDGRTNPVEEYYAGHGTGATGWAPIMGVGYYKQLVHWSKGEYADSSNTEDDLAVIAGTPNGFGFVADDFAGTVTAAWPFLGGSISGIISQQTDTDLFAFTTSGGNVRFGATPAIADPNVDILMELLDSSGALIASSNPPNALNASLSQTLTAGSYYLRVSGVGKDTPTTGYSAYGCVGTYRLSYIGDVYITAIGNLAFPPVSLGLFSQRAISLQNRGSKALDVSSITFADPAFSATPTSFSLPPRSAASVVVKFQPSSASAYADTMEVSVAGSPVLALSCSGAGISSSGPSPTPTPTPPPSSTNTIVPQGDLSFTPVKVGLFSQKSVSLQNRGSSPIAVTAVAFSNTVFTANRSAFVIPARSAASLVVTFRPTNASNYTDALSISAGGSTATTVPCKGSGFVLSP